MRRAENETKTEVREALQSLRTELDMTQPEPAEQDGYRILTDDPDMGVCVCWVHDDGRVEMNYMNDGYFALLGSAGEK